MKYSPFSVGSSNEWNIPPLVSVAQMNEIFEQTTKYYCYQNEETRL